MICTLSKSHLSTCRFEAESLLEASIYGIKNSDVFCEDSGGLNSFYSFALEYDYSLFGSTALTERLDDVYVYIEAQYLREIKEQRLVSVFEQKYSNMNAVLYITPTQLVSHVAATKA